MTSLTPPVASRNGKPALRYPPGDAWEGEAPGAPASPPEQYGNEPLPILTCGELLAVYPTLCEPVIDGLLRRGETMNIIAAPKVGKSWLSLDLACAFSTRRLWLGTFNTRGGNVLLIDNELHPETSAQRIRELAQARGIALQEITTAVSVFSLRGRLQNLTDLGARLLKIGSGRYDLIILDALYRAMPAGTDENDNGAMAGLYNQLDRFAAALNASFVLIHHATKGDQSAKAVTDVGAGAQSRATDTHLILRPHEELDAVVLDATVRSWPPVAPLCLRWSFPVWTPDPDLDPTLLRRPSSLLKIRLTGMVL